MKVYSFNAAPNPARVVIYLAEKGLDIPIESVNVLAGEHRTPEFREKSPLGMLPVLETDDGQCFTESKAIIEYFEELHPDPPMIGTTPLERLRVRGLERLCEFGVLMRIGMIVQNTHPFFAKRVDQSPATVAYARKPLKVTLTLLDEKVGDSPFVAGERPTIADCTLFASLRFAKLMGVELDLGEHGNLSRWYEEFGKRPSAQV